MNYALNPSRFFVCSAQEMCNNEIRQVKPPGLNPVAVYRVKDAFYATDDTCSHGHASLSQGEVDENYVVECPWHSGTFDIRTGKALTFPCVQPVKIYPVNVEDGGVYVELSESQTRFPEPRERK